MLKLTSIQEVVLSVSAVDAANNPAPLENVSVTSSDETVITVATTEAGYTLAATGKLGTSQIVVTADARIGDGESILTGVDTIEVVAAEAVAIALSFGEPTVKA